MSEDQIGTVLSAVSNPIRRDIVSFLAESGPQSYTALLEKFKLQTGTLNHHLGMLKALLEQDEDKKYFLNRDGQIAYQILSYTKTSLAKPAFPVVKRRVVVPALRNSAFSFYKLVFYPAKAFAEAQEHLGSYAVCGAVVMALFFASMPSLNAYTVVRSSTGLLGIILFCFAFANLLSKKNPRISHLTVSVSMTNIPTIMLNLFAILLAMFEFTPWAPLPFIIVEDPGYITLMQAFAILFVWRFVLLFFAVRESCKLSPSQSFMAVFASSLIENIIAYGIDYLFRMP